MLHGWSFHHKDQSTSRFLASLGPVPIQEHGLNSAKPERSGPFGNTHKHANVLSHRTTLGDTHPMHFVMLPEMFVYRAGKPWSDTSPFWDPDTYKGSTLGAARSKIHLSPAETESKPR